MRSTRNASMAVAIDRKANDAAKTVTIPRTGESLWNAGWKFITVPLGDVEPGLHRITLRTPVGAGPFLLDGFLLAEAGLEAKADLGSLGKLLDQRSVAEKWAEKREPVGGGELGDDVCEYLGGRAD